MIQYFESFEVREIGQVFGHILRKISENLYSREIVSE